MIEPKVKGNFFERVLQFVKKKLGPKGLEEMGVTPGDHNIDQWYPYSEFCEILRSSQDLFPDLHPTTIFKIGHFTMARDERWQTMFKGQEPKDIFSTNKRQDALFMVGRFLVEKVEDNMVQVRMTLWSNEEEHNHLWAEYYWGVMSGVLDLSGTEGEVTMDVDDEGDRKAWVYRVLWGDPQE